MFFKRILAIQNLFNGLTHQARGFSQNASSNRVARYLVRAKLIDCVRVGLRSGSSDSLIQVLCDPNVDSFVVTNALLSAPSPDSALSLIRSLQQFRHFSHTQHTLHALAKTLAKAGRTSDLKKLIDAIDGGEFKKVPRVSFMDKMRWYAAAGDLELVLCVLDEYQAQGRQRRCTESYNIVMNLYAQKGKDLEAIRTFHRLIEEGGIPNSRTYTIMIEHLVNCGKIDMAKEVFDLLPLMRVKHTLKQFSLLMDAFSKLEEYDAVKSILFEMQVEGALPVRSMLPSLQRLHGAGFLEETDEFIRSMSPNERIENVGLCEDFSDVEEMDQGFGVDDTVDANMDRVQLKPWLDPNALASALQNWKPDEVSCLEEAKIVWTSRLVSKMIRHFKSCETAWQFFCWVAYQPGFTHDVYTVSRMIVKLSRSGNFDLVDELIIKLKNEGMKLAFSTARLIVDFSGISKNGDAAIKIFRDVEILCGPVSKSNMLLLYSSLLRTLTKCGRDSDAMNLVEEMCSCGIHPDIQTFSGLMHHFAARDDFRTVQRLFGLVRQSRLEPDAYLYKVLIHEYCNGGRAALAFRLFEDMRNSELIPDGYTKALLVKSLWKEGKLREAAIVEESCEDENCTLPLALPGHLFSVSSVDLMRVYKIYSSSFPATSG